MIAIEQVSKRFVRKGRALWALEEVSLEIGRGEFVALVGPSGCGKSTLLNLIAGFMEPTQGTVRYGGRPVAGVNRRVGYLTQTDSLLPWRTAEANVALPLEIQGVPERARRERARALMQMVGLGSFEHHFPGELSGGMRKRCALAQTLAYDPETLLMDEPFGALDAQLKLILQAELLALWSRTGKTIVFVTHDLVEAITLAQRVFVFTGRPGRIKEVTEVPIDYPRDVFRVRFTPRFGEVYERLWAALQTEITRGEAV